MNKFFRIFCLIVVLFPFLCAAPALADQAQQILDNDPVGIDAPAVESDPLMEADGFDDFDAFDEFEDEQAIEVYDPLAGYNRFMTRVNDKFYIWLFKPIAKGYCFIVRKPIRQALGRVYANGLFPVDFTNNLLQLKPKRAAIVTGRFCLNSTLGIAGLFDPAGGCMGLKPYPEDFGQTMGYYGVGSGPHVVWPFIGPSNARDTIGFVPDTFLRPTYYIKDFWTVVGITVLDHFNNLSLYMDEYDALREDAFDLYIFQRDAYEASRQKKIND